MTNFTPAERVEVDRQYKVLARALHALDPKHTQQLRNVLSSAEAGSTDPTLARVLVAGEILRGVAWEGRAPLTALGNVIEHLAADGRHRRGRSKHDQHLLLRRADRDLFERALGKDITALIDLLAAGEPRSNERHDGAAVEAHGRAPELLEQERAEPSADDRRDTLGGVEDGVVGRCIARQVAARRAASTDQ